MMISYGAFNADDLCGDTLSEYLVSVEADLRIEDGGTQVYSELDFPVAELARNLLAWLKSPHQDDFLFKSESFEEVGSVKICRVEGKWTIGSVYYPDCVSRPTDWGTVEDACRAFIYMVRNDLERFGFDSTWILDE
ncbi:hypothetical protein CLV28_0272 [Sediminihabitans luteus]|uniref:DUF7878 domain-containing protein n=1 Tax=Sediminihabitans luteus TaxID=1138585 RepID=A0A2M9CYT1_9CELL|nr:hypothetical protein [Sediminihabitans luteus]PJJ77060.1 hypothetical protein CLV28_0272 [Sediminihabitans luteus]GIJ00421.1 hypothetical protein Slu03_27980 [Sediminihabitans luteus]